jgi:cardiolipin-specific phospholipase
MAEMPDSVKELLQQDVRGKVLSHLWNYNITPQRIVRMVGPLGPKLVAKYADARLSHLPPEEVENMKKYIFHICSQPGSGEFALSGIMAPLAYARSGLSKRLRQTTIPMVFMCT